MLRARLMLTVWGVAAAAVTGFAAHQADPFWIVLIPDTQYYADHDASTYTKQAEWIRDQSKVAFAIHLGDITHDDALSEWIRADAAHDILDAAKVPYSVVPGNHDYPHDSPDWPGSRDNAFYNLDQFFGPARFTGAWYKAHMGNRNDNNMSQFEVGKLRFMVLGLEMAPTKDAMCWADSVIQAHPDRRTILATHCYQKSDGSYADCTTSYDWTGADGSVLWEELVERHGNIFAVVSGHINGAAHRVRTGLSGDTIHEILTDYQKEERNGEKNGKGFLRVMEFLPDENLVKVWPHSVLGLSSFEEPNYGPTISDSNHTFQFAYDMSAPIKSNYVAPPSRRFSDRTVNTAGGGSQLKPALAVDGTAAFVAVWEDFAGTKAVRLRGFKPNGCERFKATSVASGANSKPENPDVAVSPDGAIVVVWDEVINNRRAVRARGFSPSGGAVFGPVLISQAVTGQHIKPRVARAANGDFVVVWERVDTQGIPLDRDVFARTFRADGTLLIDVGRVSSTGKGRQAEPAVSMNRKGEFVVVWEDDRNENDEHQIRARWFNAAGNAPDPDLTVNSVASGDQRRPRVGMDAAGRYVTVWDEDRHGFDLLYVWTRGLSPKGVEVFHDFMVNTRAEGQHRYADITVAEDGSFLATWQETDGNADHLNDIRIRAFNPNGTQRIRDVAVNSLREGQQLQPAIDLAPSGHFVTAWHDDVNGNGKFEILARGLHAGELAERHNRPAWP